MQQKLSQKENLIFSDQINIDSQNKLAKQNITKELYNSNASSWVRGEPSSLSDFTARPAILAMCEPLANTKVLDLGCGEGYCSRQLRQRGAKEVRGIDLSEAMIAAAKAQEEQEPLGINYEVGCATKLDSFAEGEIDLVVAVFLFNYLTIEQTQQCMSEVFRILATGGRFIFSVPHPAFPYMGKTEYPFYFQVEGNNYFSARDRLFSGRIWKRDGNWLGVQLVHKTLQDYFEALQKAGFSSLPKIQELHVQKEHLQLDPAFFSSLVDLPLHLAFEISK